MELFENVLPGAGMAVEAGGSQQDKPGGTASSFPFQHRALTGTDGAKNPRQPRVGAPLGAGASLLSKWVEISNPAASREHSTRPGPFPQAGWFTGKFPASVNVKPEWILDLSSPTHPCLLLSPCSRAEGPGGCGRAKPFQGLRH